VEGLCEHGNEPSGSIRKQDIFDKLIVSFSNNILHHGVSTLTPSTEAAGSSETLVSSHITT
jgi:hypothetical protein